MTIVQIILLVIAVLLLILGTVTRTNNLLSGIVFKFFPTMSAILLTLIAFKVIV
jgi:hypothetical protein